MKIFRKLSVRVHEMVFEEYNYIYNDDDQLNTAPETVLTTWHEQVAISQSVNQLGAPMPSFLHPFHSHHLSIV